MFNLKNLHDDYSGHVTLVVMAGLPLSIHLAVSRAVEIDLKNLTIYTSIFKTGLYCAPTHVLAKTKSEWPNNLNIEDYPAIGITGLSSSNYISDDLRMNIQTFSDSYDMCMAGIMSGEYVGLLPDYMAKEQGVALGLVPVGGGKLFHF